MKRRLLNLLAALSLLLSLACAAAWVRSYWFIDQLIVARGGVLFRAGHERGSFIVDWTDPWPGKQRIGPWMRHDRLPPPPPDRGWDWGRLRQFGYVTRLGEVALQPQPVRVPEHVLWFPQWALVLALSVLPLWVLGRGTARLVRNRSRAARHLCPACGYDLRATPGRCPECGHTPEGAPA
jgi:hypothetical protein